MRVGAGLRHASALALLLVTSLLASSANATAAPPKAPSATVKVAVGDIVSVEVKADPGKEVAWAPGFPPEAVYLDEGKPLSKDTARFIVSPKKPGVYRLILWSVGEREYSTLVIDAGGKAPKDDETTDDKTDEDKKDDEVKPPPPVPVAKGLRVIFWYENRARLTTEQERVIFGARIESYLNGKCAKVDDQPEWRRWDKDVTLDADESPNLKALHGKVKTSVPEAKMPVMVVFNDAAGEFYSLTNPKDGKTLTEDQALAILKQYGGE